MDYIPGPIHEELQKSKYLLLNSSFTFLTLNVRYKDWSGSLFQNNYTINEPHTNKDWSENLVKDSSLILDKDDILEYRVFKPTMSSQSLYLYIDKVYRNNNTITYISTESIVSLSFIEVNKSIFQDVTYQFIRDSKIDLILS